MSEAKLLGRLHHKNGTWERLFSCVCGKSHWLKEPLSRIICGNCGRIYYFQRQGKNYSVRLQEDLFRKSAAEE